MTSPFFLSVAVAAPLPKLFDYRPLADTDMRHYQAGLRVSVPFGARLLSGVIVSIHQAPQVDPAKLKPIAALLDSTPLLPSDLYQLGHWLSEYYHQPIGECLSLLWPLLLRKGEPARASKQNFYAPADNPPDPSTIKRAPRQVELLAHMTQSAHHDGCWQQDLVQAGFTPAIINGLVTKGFLVKQARDCFQPIKGQCSQTPLTLNQEQQHALTCIEQSQGFNSFLIDGITGSGKTEVYLQAIAPHVQQGLQVLILVPEIGLTPQTVQRFAQRFEADVLLLHSKLSDRERLDAWLMARTHDASTGRGQIIIGTRSAIFTPMPNLAMIVIDEEHDQSFKQQDGVRYHGRDVAVVRAKTLAIPIILGSATPSLECLHNGLNGKYQYLRLSQRAGAASMPELQILNIKNQAVHHGLADSLLPPIEDTLHKGQQVLVFVNRRGYAPTLYCPDCAWIAECRHCDAKMTLHQKPAHLHCHHCDSKLSIPRQCPECLSHKIQAMGAGTERLESHLQYKFQATPVIRIDRDSTQNKHAMETLLAPVHGGEPCIIVGTQMLAKGHHFPKVTLVIMINVDSGFFSADYRAMEKTAQLILQVAGRAGREKDQGVAVLQTEFSEHPMLHLLKEESYHALSLALLDERQHQHLPPYGFQLLLRADCHLPQEAERFLHRVRQLLNQHQQALNLPQLSMIGPLPAPMELRAGRFRSQLWVSARRRTVLHSFIGRVLPDIYALKGFHKVRWGLDIDPIESL
ncbi:MAG: primosomal protein N' [Bermanella sp.]